VLTNGIDLRSTDRHAGASGSTRPEGIPSARAEAAIDAAMQTGAMALETVALNMIILLASIGP
jgi:hypothetical protein